jgi:hypothetical protein
VKSLLSADESTIRKGFRYANSVTRKYIYINRNTEGSSKHVQYNSNKNGHEVIGHENDDHNLEKSVGDKGIEKKILSLSYSRKKIF